MPFVFCIVLQSVQKPRLLRRPVILPSKVVVIDVRPRTRILSSTDIFIVFVLCAVAGVKRVHKCFAKVSRNAQSD